MTKPTLRERQRQVREEAILEVAYDLLSEQGYEAMSMDELATHVGISKATMYQHFPSKEDVAVRVVVKMMQEGEHTLFTPDEALPAIARIERGLRYGLSQRISHWTTRLNIQPFKVTQHPQYQMQLQRFAARLSELIDQAKADGDINAQLPTPILAHTMIVLFKLDFEVFQKDYHCSTEQIVEALMTFIINGMKRPALADAVSNSNIDSNSNQGETV